MFTDYQNNTASELKIVETIAQALQFTTLQDYKNLVVVNCAADTALALTPLQILSMKIIANTATGDLQSMLDYILFGDYQTVGLLESVGNANFTTEQRQRVIAICYETAVSIINEQIVKMQSLISWTYTLEQ